LDATDATSDGQLEMALFASSFRRNTTQSVRPITARQMRRQVSASS
jgi:hypothetical protein